MFCNLKTGERVVVSVIPEVRVEIGEVVSLSKRIIVIRSPRLIWWREFDRRTGTSVRGECFGKLLGPYDLAIRETREVECTSCGVPQKNFFMAHEYLSGGKNFICYNCGEVLWISVDGTRNLRTDSLNNKKNSSGNKTSNPITMDDERE